MKQRLKLRGRAIIDAGDVIRIAIARDVASDDGLADRAADAVARSIAGAGIDPEYLTGDLSNVTYASYRARAVSSSTRTSKTWSARGRRPARLAAPCWSARCSVSETRELTDTESLLAMPSTERMSWFDERMRRDYLEAVAPWRKAVAGCASAGVIADSRAWRNGQGS